MEVEVQAGNRTASQYAQPGLWAWLDGRRREQWPHLLRGDISWGSERMMQEAERRQLPYVFKLKKTSKVNRQIEKLWGREDGEVAGAGWQGLSSELQLSGWSRPRRVVILRRQLRETVAVSEEEKRTGQRVFTGMAELKRGQELYEYTVLVTSVADEVLSIAQLYRDRAEAENIFDELKNPWGWTGFTTQDVRRCQILARTIAVIYNWWSLFTRLAIPNRPHRGPHQPATAAQRRRTTDDAQPSDAADNHQHACPGACGSACARGRKHVPSTSQANCGAVDIC